MLRVLIYPRRFFQLPIGEMIKYQKGMYKVLESDLEKLVLQSINTNDPVILMWDAKTTDFFVREDRYPENEKNNILETPVNTLNIAPIVIKALQERNIETLNDLMCLGKDDLTNDETFKSGWIKQIEKALVEYQINFDDC